MSRVRLPGFLLLSMMFVEPAAAAEPYLEFVQGLRERGYFDMALSYLQQLEADPAVPEDVRRVIPYEQGVTLLEGARRIRNPDAQTRQLDEAEALFERFVQGAPSHPLIGLANTERARILLNKARVEAWQASAPANEGNEEPFRQRARDLIARARTVFQEARDQHQREWSAFPTFIPEEDRQQRAARAAAEARFMQAQLDLGRCTYEEAQTYDPGTDRREELLLQAAAEFDDIHQRYRSQIAGLHARMWQAKCFEEQNDIRKALGIYNEILEHPGQSLQDLKDRVLWFRLICLNHEQRKDFPLVLDEATSWLKDAKSRARTDVGLGIQYELARAQEVLGSERSETETNQRNLLSQALNRARDINRYPGPLKAASGAMIQRLMVALNREPGDPTDFDTAYGTANLLLEETKTLSSQADAALAQGQTEEAVELRESLRASAAEMSRLYELALQLATPETEQDQLNIAHFKLAYSYFLQGKHLEAGILASYIAARQKQDYPEVALESAYIALAAFDRVYFEAEDADRHFEMQQLLDVATMITETWPESDRAVDALMATARVYRQADQPDEAAAWFAKVPKSAQQYANAQISAGQSYWNAYLTRAALPPEERPEAEALQQWKLKAEQFLQEGIAQRQSQLPAAADSPDDLILAKLSLVQIRNSDGVYHTQDEKLGAIELLSESPHAVLAAVAVADGEPRPTRPGSVQSKAIASLAYQQLLRSQIGTRDLEAARTTREQLESIAGAGEDAGALTQVYVEFGRELQKELEQLQASGATERLNDVRSAFESFLGDLFQRSEGQTFNSLLWIAETYTGLAEGSSDQPDKAAEYFTKAASTYQDMLNRGANDPQFVDDPAKLLGVKLRLVHCHRESGDYEQAESVLLEVLTERPNALDAQIEAARLYQQWAEQGIGNKSAKLAIAIQGQQTPTEVWGWGALAQKLQRFIEYGDGGATHTAKHIDARYNLALCEYELAQEQTTNAAMDEHLQNARFGIQRFIAISDELSDADWTRLNKLYQKILSELGEPAQPLRRPTGRPVDVAAATPGVVQAAAGQPAEPGRSAPTSTVSPPAAARSTNYFMIALLGLLGLGSIAGIYVLNQRRERQRRERLAAVVGRSSSQPRSPSRARK